jgi:hypothetical protein
MKTVYIICFVTGIMSMMENLMKAEDILEQSQSYSVKLKQIAEKMEVFPIDLIARKGPLATPYKMVYYEELTIYDFRAFYNFCELALSATEKDIETCLGKLEYFSPKEQALLLTIIYVYSFPWSDKLSSDLLMQDRQKNKMSWLGLNYTNLDKKNRQYCDIYIRTKYQLLIKRFINNDKIAFPKVILDFDKKNKNENERITLRYDIKEEIGEEKMREYELDIISRKEYFLDLEKRYPHKYRQKISDILFIFYPSDYFPYLTPSGIGPEHGNTSSTPKTLGQIAQQLIDSWEPTKPISTKEKNISPTLPPLPSFEFKMIP